MPRSSRQLPTLAAHSAWRKIWLDCCSAALARLRAWVRAWSVMLCSASSASIASGAIWSGRKAFALSEMQHSAPSGTPSSPRIGTPRYERMKGAPVTRLLPSNRVSNWASGTSIGPSPSMQNAQKESPIFVSTRSVPVRPRNHWWSCSTTESSAIGQPSMVLASRVMRENSSRSAIAPRSRLRLASRRGSSFTREALR